MPPELHPAELVSSLQGTWYLGATNLPHWLTGGRNFPTITYQSVARHPTRVLRALTYVEGNDHEVRISGVSHWRHGEFISRDKRLHKVFRSRWTVAGISDDDSVAVIRFTETRAMPAGINVLVRDGAAVADLRSTVAVASTSFGLSAEDFARLTWFDTTESVSRRSSR